ncbi:MAG: DUF4174 domain-containing protein [Bacteroidota bacterium]
MKRFLFLSCIIFIAGIFSTQLSMAQSPLEEFKWKNRILVIYGHIDSMKEQLHALGQDNTEKYWERDLLVFLAIKDGERMQGNRNLFLHHNEKNEGWEENDYSNIVRLYFNKEKAFQVVLIGKDGGVKLKKNQAIDIQDIFDLIDSMPMRQAEMRDKN